MEFRPCIDIHNGKVKQIVGGSLMDQGNQATENFVSDVDAWVYAKLYQKKGLKGGHVILLNASDSEFFEATNACIANYKGANLAKCFESVINDEKEKTAQLKKTIYEAQMLYVQQQQVSAMQYNNYLQQQRNYQLSRPRYTNTTITPIGNTYYMNSYSY